MYCQVEKYTVEIGDIVRDKPVTGEPRNKTITKENP